MSQVSVNFATETKLAQTRSVKFGELARVATAAKSLIVRSMIDCDFGVLVGFEHSSFVFAQEANMHENRFNEYRIPSGMLIVFLEKALTLIHMETHLDDVSHSLNLQLTAYCSPAPHFGVLLVTHSLQKLLSSG